jgi:hypothetical protein
MLNGMTLNELAAECHENNKKWWHDLTTGERLVRNKGELLMLVASEIAEAMEGERKNLQDDKLPHRKMAEVELVDAVIRLADFAGGFGLDLDEAAKRLGPMPHEMIDGFPANKGEGLFAIVKVIVMIDDADSFLGGFSEVSEDPAELIVAALGLIDLYAAINSYDLGGAYTEKTAFNKVRKDHTKEGRLAENGKKW